MDYKELEKCLAVLRRERKWYHRAGFHAEKIECLNKIKASGAPDQIHYLIEFMRDSNSGIQLETAEVVVHLFSQLKSHNELYRGLQFVSIDVEDLDYYKGRYLPDIYVRILAIASMNRNGYVRERAVVELSAIRHPYAVRFLLMRLNDWVHEVRIAAHRAVSTYLTADYLDALLQLLPLVESMGHAQRSSMAEIQREIMEYVVGSTNVPHTYERLKSYDGRIRMVYVRYLLATRATDIDTVNMLLNDKYFMVRVELLKHVHLLDASIRKKVVNKYLYDRSTKVKIGALYESIHFRPDYDSVILEMSTDESASVRGLVRFILKEESYDFADIYMQRLTREIGIVGSILGLAEVGKREQVPLIERHFLNPSTKVKIACLSAIHRLDQTLSKQYALECVTHQSNKVRNKSIEILTSNNDEEVLKYARTKYLSSDCERRRSILKLYVNIGGWDVVGDIIGALNDNDNNVQDQAWRFLRQWRERQRGVFSTPSVAERDLAIARYNQFDKTKTRMTYDREQLWTELPFFLR